MVGIYCGLRISDILKLKVSDVKDKNYIKVRETKTGKEKIFPINPILKKVLKEYTDNRNPDEYLIKSREGYNQPISREMAYMIFKDIGRQFGVENLGTHTMRKTFGYHFYKQTKDVVKLMKIFNHSDPSITLHYIGIEQESINDAMNKFKI
jgi:integrase